MPEGGLRAQLLGLMPQELPPHMHSLSSILVELNGQEGGWDITLEGLDEKDEPLEWKGHALFLQRLEEIIRSLRKNSNL